MIKRWNVNDIKNQIQEMVWAITDPRQDGFSTWPVKQDLYKIKWEVEAALSKCPEYAPEKDFLENHQKQVMWNTLNEKTNR